jgi:hypothetical protein
VKKTASRTLGVVVAIALAIANLSGCGASGGAGAQSSSVSAETAAGDSSSSSEMDASMSDDSTPAEGETPTDSGTDDLRLHEYLTFAEGAGYVRLEGADFATSSAQLTLINGSLIRNISAFGQDLADNPDAMDRVPTDFISSTSDSILVEGMKSAVKAELARQPADAKVVALVCPNDSSSEGTDDPPVTYGCASLGAFSHLASSSATAASESDVGIRFAVKLADGTWLPEDDPAQFTVVKLGSDFTLEVSPDGYLRFTPN